jgi:Tol biopolymer transport system component
MRRRLTAAIAAAATIASVAAIVAPPPAGALIAYIITSGRVSVTAASAQHPAGVDGDHIEVSEDGRFVAFTSDGALVPEDTNGGEDVYLRDRMGGTTTRVSLTDADGQIGGTAELCGMSRNGRYVAFVGFGAGLTFANQWQLYLRDRIGGTTEVVSVSTGGDPSDSALGESGIYAEHPCPVSDDGRYVAFVSEAENLAGGDENGSDDDIFRRDLLTDSTQRVSLSTVGLGGNAESLHPSMSANGQEIAFQSAATNLVPNDSNAKLDVFVRSMGASQTERVSVTAAGSQLSQHSFEAAISADGNEVAFVSSATNLVAGDTNAKDDAFIRDRGADTVVRATRGTDGGQIGANATDVGLSADGSVVTWSMYFNTAVPGDANLEDDVYRFKLSETKATLVSVKPNPGGGDGSAATGQSQRNAISADGLVVAFLSEATDVVRNDTNGAKDAFVRDYQNLLTPFLSPKAFTKQQYVDFEGRQPTTAELDEWTARITNGERTPDELVDELAHGTTWAGKRAPLTRLYWAFFLRPPDSGGMTYWSDQLAGGKALTTVAKQFSQSSEFKTTYGSLSNQAFVTKIYQNIFQRNPDPGGLAYWTGKLSSKAKTRGDVMVNFSESNEGKRRLAPQTDTVLIYLGMLRKMPTLAIVLEGIAAIRDHGYPAEIVAESVREQSEYADRVVQT